MRAGVCLVEAASNLETANQALPYPPWKNARPRHGTDRDRRTGFVEFNVKAQFLLV
jgi:hypothetical protein